MGNAISFRLNPQCESDRKMIVTADVPEPSIPDNELATDTSNAMDNATKSMLGSLFDMDDE